MARGDDGSFGAAVLLISRALVRLLMAQNLHGKFKNLSKYKN
jgi:hypothetical protein